LNRTVLIFFIAVILNAQQKSIHQIESEYYSSRIHNHPILTNILPLTKPFGSSKLNKTVFGYLPYWEYQNGSHLNLRYDLLSHMAVFSFTADKNGNLIEPEGWPWISVMSLANQNDVKLILTVTNFNGDEINQLLTDSKKKFQLIENIMKVMLQYGFKGVNIDFENLKDSDKSILIGDFASALKNYLSHVNTVLEVSFALPPVNFGGWNFDNIARSCDYVVIMAYDFYGGWSETTSPSAPLTGTYYNITNSFQKDYALLLSNNPDKIILSVPYYGNYWKTKAKEAYTKVDTTASKREWVKALAYKDIVPFNDSNEKEKLWDNISSTPWIRWLDATWNQIWYDNDSSLALKYNFALQKNLGGIGIWALGYDDRRTELWKIIEKKFTPTYIENTRQPESFHLLQNYPNPFNPNTVIGYQISSLSKVQLKVYDILGREVATLVDEVKNPGNFNVPFSTSAVSGQFNSQLSSGVYFYKLTAGEYTSVKKMQLLK
jgi:spore germination protein YaaH